MQKTNRLKYHKIYFCGPMDFSREKGKIWRDELIEYCNNMGIICLNPYNKELNTIHGEFALEDDINSGKVKEALENKDYKTASERMKFVRSTDLRLVDRADALVVRLDFDVIMTGTIEEICTANRQKKPIIIWSSVPKNKIPPWYFGQLKNELFFESIEEVKEYLRHINEDKYIDTLGRWVFFNLESRINEIHNNQGLELW